MKCIYLDKCQTDTVEQHGVSKLKQSKVNINLLVAKPMIFNFSGLSLVIVLLQHRNVMQTWQAKLLPCTD